MAGNSGSGPDGGAGLQSQGVLQATRTQNAEKLAELKKWMASGDVGSGDGDTPVLTDGDADPGHRRGTAEFAHTEMLPVSSANEAGNVDDCGDDAVEYGSGNVERTPEDYLKGGKSPGDSVAGSAAGPGKGVNGGPGQRSSAQHESITHLSTEEQRKQRHELAMGALQRLGIQLDEQIAAAEEGVQIEEQAACHALQRAENQILESSEHLLEEEIQHLTERQNDLKMASFRGLGLSPLGAEDSAQHEVPQRPVSEASQRKTPTPLSGGSTGSSPPRASTGSSPIRVPSSQVMDSTPVDEGDGRGKTAEGSLSVRVGGGACPPDSQPSTPVATEVISEELLPLASTPKAAACMAEANAAASAADHAAAATAAAVVATDNAALVAATAGFTSACITAVDEVDNAEGMGVAGKMDELQLFEMGRTERSRNITSQLTQLQEESRVLQEQSMRLQSRAMEVKARVLAEREAKAQHALQQSARPKNVGLSPQSSAVETGQASRRSGSGNQRSTSSSMTPNDRNSIDKSKPKWPSLSDGSQSTKVPSAAPSRAGLSPVEVSRRRQGGLSAGRGNQPNAGPSGVIRGGRKPPSAIKAGGPGSSHSQHLDAGQPDRISSNLASRNQQPPALAVPDNVMYPASQWGPMQMSPIMSPGVPMWGAMPMDAYMQSPQSMMGRPVPEESPSNGLGSRRGSSSASAQGRGVGAGGRGQGRSGGRQEQSGAVIPTGMPPPMPMMPGYAPMIPGYPQMQVMMMPGRPGMPPPPYPGGMNMMYNMGMPPNHMAAQPSPSSETSSMRPARGGIRSAVPQAPGKHVGRGREGSGRGSLRKVASAHTQNPPEHGPMPWNMPPMGMPPMPAPPMWGAFPGGYPPYGWGSPMPGQGPPNIPYGPPGQSMPRGYMIEPPPESTPQGMHARAEAIQQAQMNKYQHTEEAVLKRLERLTSSPGGHGNARDKDRAPFRVY